MFGKKCALLIKRRINLVKKNLCKLSKLQKEISIGTRKMKVLAANENISGTERWKRRDESSVMVGLWAKLFSRIAVAF